MLKKLAFSGIEKTINAYLQLDSDIQRLLNPLSGKIVTIELIDPRCKIHFLFEKAHVRLLDTLSIKPDAYFKGRSFSFIKHYFNNNSTAKRNIEIEGDSAVIIHFSELFQKVDIDWEDQLSTIVGDHFAHGIGKLVRNMISCGTEWKSTVTQNMSEYLHEEINFFPSPEEVTLFLDDVDMLRNDVERLEAKIKLYQQRS